MRNFRRTLLAEKTDCLAGDGSSISPLADHLLAQVEMIARRMYRLGETPEYEPDPRTCLAAEAAATGRTALEVIYLLMCWGCDRATGRMPIERPVKMQAYDTARYMGFGDRGEIAVGQRADINVIDLSALRLGRPELHADLPGGGRRLMPRAWGYRATICAGEVVVDHGRVTHARPGRLARGGQAAVAG